MWALDNIVYRKCPMALNKDIDNIGLDISVDIEHRYVNPEVVGSNHTLVNSLFNPQNHIKIYPVSFPCGLY